LLTNYALFLKHTDEEIRVQAYYRSGEFQEVEAPRCRDNRKMKVVRF